MRSIVISAISSPSSASSPKPSLPGNQQGRFTIKTDKPEVKVSWQVTGIRQDAWANAHRIPPEEDKPLEKRGTYLHPELYGGAANKKTSAMLQPDGCLSWSAANAARF